MFMVAFGCSLSLAQDDLFARHVGTDFATSIVTGHVYKLYPMGRRLRRSEDGPPTSKMLSKIGDPQSSHGRGMKRQSGDYLECGADVVAKRSTVKAP